MSKVQIRGPVAWYSNFPDVFYVICEYDNEGIDFTTIDATVDEAVAQEQVMAHAFEEAYETYMRNLHMPTVPEVGKAIADLDYDASLRCTRYFYKKVDLRKEI